MTSFYWGFTKSRRVFFLFLEFSIIFNVDLVFLHWPHLPPHLHLPRLLWWTRKVTASRCIAMALVASTSYRGSSALLPSPYSVRLRDPQSFFPYLSASRASINFTVLWHTSAPGGGIKGMRKSYHLRVEMTNHDEDRAWQYTGLPLCCSCSSRYSSVDCFCGCFFWVVAGMEKKVI